MALKMFTIRDGLNQTEYVLARLSIESISQDSIGRVQGQFDFRVINDDVAVAFNPQFGSDLHRDGNLV